MISTDSNFMIRRWLLALLIRLSRLTRCIDVPGFILRTLKPQSIFTSLMDWGSIYILEDQARFAGPGSVPEDYREYPSEGQYQSADLPEENTAPSDGFYVDLDVDE
ncbi:uncharacterized protein [Triticum aestivum]|uniref:uncharacterized protein n=1 Tax=Triticum aestivum TaxID=4565 RepID=UPI001D007EF2|nr:uncharacterized protein LOC123166377 [Triticum aestivum]